MAKTNRQCPNDFQDYCYFLDPLGRKAGSVATQLFLLMLQTLPFSPLAPPSQIPI